MSALLSFKNPTVIATYSSRPDAEMAKGRLDEQGIPAAVTSDDAGGAHPQLQLTQGVRLVVAEPDAQTAREVLSDLDLLPSEAGGETVLNRYLDEYAFSGTLLKVGGTLIVGAGLGWAVTGVQIVGAVVGVGVIVSMIGVAVRWNAARGLGQASA